MPMIWTEAAVAKLFLGVLATSDVKIDHKALADYMGPECTVEAIKQKVRKLKAAEKDELAAPAVNGNGKAQKSTGKRKKTRDVEADGDDAEETPVKHKKSKKAYTKAAAEDDGESLKGENGGNGD